MNGKLLLNPVISLSLVLAAVSSLANPSVVLAATGTLSGTVYADDGVTPLDHIAISAQSSDWSYNSADCTDANGQYTITDVPFDRPVRLRANTYHDSWCDAAADYVPEYWQETLEDGPTLLTLTANTPQQSGLDFNLDPSGSRPVPNLDVWYLDGYIEAFDWPLGTHLKLKIDDPATPLSPDYSAETDVTGFVPWAPDVPLGTFNLDGQFEIEPGMFVSVSGGYQSAFILVDNLTVTSIDQNLDTITGTTGPNNWLWMFFEPSCCRSTVADSNGVWVMDFSSPGPNGEPVADIGSGASGGVHVPSGDGRTSVLWSVPIVTVQFNPATTSLGVGDTAVVQIDLNEASELYGYQFQVYYDASKVEAVSEFVNTFFDTTGGVTPPGWNAECAAGVCQFAVSHVSPAPTISGSGTLAQITFTGLAPGSVAISFGSDVLSDYNGQPIAHTNGAATLTVYGTATLSGTVKLQGRLAPGDTAGTVTLTDISTTFDPVVVPIAADGTWIAEVPVIPSGSNYLLDAAHPLYLTNERPNILVTAGNSYPQPTTKLRGGDANNDSTISISDLSCIGGDFGGAPGTCDGTGSSDLNADGTVNILDLVLAGGNYGLSDPLSW